MLRTTALLARPPISIFLLEENCSIAADLLVPSVWRGVTGSSGVTARLWHAVGTRELAAKKRKPQKGKEDGGGAAGNRWKGLGLQG
jgi:hypothetical protein